MELRLLAAFGDRVAESRLKGEDTIERLSFSGCDRYVAAGDHGGRIHVYRIKAAEQRRTPFNFSRAASIQAFRARACDPRVVALQWLPRVDLNPCFVAADRTSAL